MNKIVSFCRRGTEQFRWHHFSLKRMCWFSLFLFIFFIGWRLLFTTNGSNEIAFPRILRHLSLAIFLGFIYAFQKPLESETEES